MTRIIRLRLEEFESGYIEIKPELIYIETSLNDDEINEIIKIMEESTTVSGIDRIRRVVNLIGEECDRVDVPAFILKTY